MTMDILVVGAGIIGMFASYYLIRNGFSVTIVDMDSTGGRTSICNAGLIVPSFATTPPIGLRKILPSYIGRQGPVYVSPREILKNTKWLGALRNARTSERPLIEFGKRSLQFYKDFFAEECIDVDLAKGVVGLYKNADLAGRTAQQMNGRFIDEQEARHLGFTGFGGGVLFEEELSVNPSKLHSGLRKRLSEMGVSIVLGREAQLQGARPRIKSALVGGEELKADIFVAAAGAWSRDLCAHLGYDPQILPGRGLRMTFETGGSKLTTCAALFEDYGIAVTQNNVDTLTATGFFELKGFQNIFSQSRKKWFLNVIRNHLIDQNKLTQVGEDVGFRPCTSDQLPVIGKVPGYQNLVMASGHCRLGITLAPATGDIVRSIVTGTTTQDVSLPHFDPLRFETRLTM
jgi:D-amino-acid dehydrogenase